MGAASRFSFVDESEAVRRLGVDHDTVLSLVRDGRLRAYKGVGKGSFFKLADLLALAEELHPPAPQVAAAEPEPTAPATARRPQHDPAYKVHLRLQADLKWYDLTDADFRTWVRELHPEGYSRQRTNINAVIVKLQRLLALMDEAAAGWENLATRPANTGLPGQLGVADTTAGRLAAADTVSAPDHQAGGGAEGEEEPAAPQPDA